jgi:penicillin-binding protein 1B
MPPKAVITVLDAADLPITHRPFELEQSIRPEDAATLNRALEIVMAKGTGRSSPFARSGVAGKTGTSNDNRDSWFAGFDNRRVAVVWVGRDDNAVTGLTGTSGALRVWNEVARLEPIEPLVHPPSEDLLEIEFASGLRATASCADVVTVPVPDRHRVPIKPGCDIRVTVRDRLRQWFAD